MANYACVAIGISRYQFLQPLSYGDADAQSLQQFLVEQASLPSEHCLLLTDTSPRFGEYSTYPSRENILSWLEAVGQNSLTDGSNTTALNWRWFFFSGYGVSWQQVDYIMPIDGNPEDIPGTGIPMQFLFESLKTQGNENLLVLLDINRSPGFEAGNPPGRETVELAHEMGISLVLSSQLDEFSHEAAALGNGIFTAALLEALRYYHCQTTLNNLYQYLHSRTPELSHHHWRPLQTPLLVMPINTPTQGLILPLIANPLQKERLVVGSNGAVINNTGEETNSTGANSSTITDSSTPQTGTNTSLVPRNPAPLNQIEPKPGAIVSYPNNQSRSDSNQNRWWQRLLLWGGAALILALIIAAVVLRNRESFITQQALEPVSKPSPQTSLTNPNTEITASSPVPAATLSTQESASTIPKPDPIRIHKNQTTLAQAKGLIQPNQASLFSQAITVARKVQPGDPLYEEAQENIRRWSLVILDLAEGRAKQGNFQGAIAAAQLVSKENSSVHIKAQEKIEQWQVLFKQQQQNQAIIQAARQKVERYQASSYNRAISILRKVPSGQPGYTEAQELISQASRTIYLIANSRAARGNFEHGIETAALVPKNTPYYQDAQKAIARWQKSNKK
ncbi:MAG: peptidase C14 [Symploca sp. SIO2E9]|nr:peptidase C14 [Symploca sp. SIO2E9]